MYFQFFLYFSILVALSISGSTIGQATKNSLTKQTSNSFLPVHVQSRLPGLVLDIFTSHKKELTVLSGESFVS